MIPTGVVCDLIVAKEKGDYMDKKVYLIEGENGFWRRINRLGRTGVHTPVEGARVVHVAMSGQKDRLYELVRWVDMEAYVALKSSDAECVTFPKPESTPQLISHEVTTENAEVPADTLAAATTTEHVNPPSYEREELFHGQ